MKSLLSSLIYTPFFLTQNVGLQLVLHPGWKQDLLSPPINNTLSNSSSVCPSSLGLLAPWCWSSTLGPACSCIVTKPFISKILGKTLMHKPMKCCLVESGMGLWSSACTESHSTVLLKNTRASIPSVGKTLFYTKEICVAQSSFPE
jgi:hypothetical protein